MDGLVDIDECTSSPCGVSAECIDTVGSFVCICTYVTTNACLAAAIINAMRASSHACQFIHTYLSYSKTSSIIIYCRRSFSISFNSSHCDTCRYGCGPCNCDWRSTNEVLL